MSQEKEREIIPWQFECYICGDLKTTYCATSRTCKHSCCYDCMPMSFFSGQFGSTHRLVDGKAIIYPGRNSIDIPGLCPVCYYNNV